MGQAQTGSPPAPRVAPAAMGVESSGPQSLSSWTAGQRDRDDEQHRSAFGSVSSCAAS